MRGKGQLEADKDSQQNVKVDRERIGDGSVEGSLAVHKLVPEADLQACRRGAEERISPMPDTAMAIDRYSVSDLTKTGQ